MLGEAEEKLLKAAQEVNQLRVEESTLRQENLQLRVNINRLFFITLLLFDLLLILRYAIRINTYANYR